MCIVGAGYTGLWTAYYLNRADPALRIVVLEASFAGYGASGRNGGWVTAELPGSRARYASHPRGKDGVRELERYLRDTVDEVARVCAAEGIDASLVKGGTLTVATSAARGGEAAPPAGAGTGVGRRRRDRSVSGKDGTGRQPEGDRGGRRPLLAALCPRAARRPGCRAGRDGHPGRGPARRGHPGDVDIGRGGLRPRPATCAHLIYCAAPRGSPRTSRASTGRRRR